MAGAKSLEAHRETVSLHIAKKMEVQTFGPVIQEAMLSLSALRAVSKRVAANKTPIWFRHRAPTMRNVRFYCRFVQRG